mmetsp:Transcript_12580/g.37819  ORF Transcript_12580/g.37819 Transcript_12580/m.37819 type:complete len:634 (-) Transcript_12580:213-2114(-)
MLQMTALVCALQLLIQCAHASSHARLHRILPLRVVLSPRSQYAAVISSEPLSESEDDWLAVPRNHMMTILPEHPCPSHIANVAGPREGKHPMPLRILIDRISPGDLEDHFTVPDRDSLCCDTSMSRNCPSLPSTTGPTLPLSVIGPNEPHSCGAAGTVGSCMSLSPRPARASVTRIHASADIAWVADVDAHAGLSVTAISWLRGQEESEGAGLLLTGGTDRNVRAWDPATYSCLRTFTGHSRGILSVAGHCVGRTRQHAWNGRSLALSSAADDTIRLWDVATGEALAVLKNRGLVLTVSVLELASGEHASANTECTSFLCVGCQDATLKCIPLAALADQARAQDSSTQSMHTDSLVGCTLRGHSGQVQTICACARRWLCSGSSDGTLMLWRMAETDSTAHSVSAATFAHAVVGATCDRLALGHRVLAHAATVLCVTFDPDRCFLISGAADASLSVHHVPSTGETPSLISSLHAHDAAVTCLAMAGSLLMSGSADGTCNLWSLDNLNLLYHVVPDLASRRVEHHPPSEGGARSHGAEDGLAVPDPPPPRAPVGTRAAVHAAVHCDCDATHGSNFQLSVDNCAGSSRARFVVGLSTGVVRVFVAPSPPAKDIQLGDTTPTGPAATAQYNHASPHT